MVFFIAVINQMNDCDMQSDSGNDSFPHAQEKSNLLKDFGLFKHEKSASRNIAITVKHAMSKAMNNTVSFNLFF